MFSWEGYRQLVGLTRISHVPSLLERGGDFSQSFSVTGAAIRVTDPLNGNAPFPNNVMPVSRFHPSAVKLMDYYPLPNRADRRSTTLPWPTMTISGTA